MTTKPVGAHYKKLIAQLQPKEKNPAHDYHHSHTAHNQKTAFCGSNHANGREIPKTFSVAVSQWF